MNFDTNSEDSAGKLSKCARDVAIKLAKERGWHCLPVVTGEKRPKTSHGYKSAKLVDESDSEFRDGDWLGIATGPSGLIVLDLDIHKAVGKVNWEKLRDEHDIPETLTVETKSGGLHLYFRAPQSAQLKTTLGAAEGIDVLASTSFVVAPPSAGYVLSCDSPSDDFFSCDVADAPDWLIAMTSERSAPMSREQAAAVEESLLFKLFDSAGMTHGAVDSRRLWVECPWSDEHSNKATKGDAVIFPPNGANGSKLGGFHCQHLSHGPKRSVDVLGWFRDNFPAASEAAERAMPAPAEPVLNIVSTEEGAPLPWSEALVRSRDGELIDNESNLTLLFAHHPRLAQAFALDEFGSVTVMLRAIDEDDSRQYPRRREASDSSAIAAWLTRPTRSGGAGMRNVSKSRVRECLEASAARNRFDSLRDHIEALPVWDGVKRLDSWLTMTFDCEMNDYNAEAGSLLVRAMVARALTPGVKFDYCVVFEGAQGVGKSTVARILAGDVKWFRDSLPDMHSNDGKMQLARTWVAELAELAAMRRSDIESTKAMLSACEDVYRVPYADTETISARRCVFIATTNDDAYLVDRTGNRRFLPIHCSGTACGEGFNWLSDNREQLLAEARAQLIAGEKLWLSPVLTEEQSRQTETRQESIPFELPFSRWLTLQHETGRKDFTTEEAVVDALQIEPKEFQLNKHGKPFKLVVDKLFADKFKSGRMRRSGVQLRGYMRIG